jgi:3-oxoacyl-[acyl-carrier protein] reductase
MRRTILITGSAKRLGAALAKGLAADGHRIALHCRCSREAGELTRQEILKAGGEASLFISPLVNLNDAAQLVQEIVAQFGSLDTVINNAGTFNRKGFEEMTQAEWDAGFASTAGAAFITIRASLSQLRASGRGRIVNLGDSASDRIGFTENSMSYYIGKVGLWMMTQTLAATEAPHKITVNMVSPGVLDDSTCDTPESEMPLGRYGTYDDVLRPIRFLLEDGTEAITGTNIHAGGGWNIK